MTIPLTWIPLRQLLDRWQDGDEHGWDTEFAFLRAEHADRLAVLRESIARDGIQEPVYLGTDGRIWDGHHRLCVADELGIDEIPVTTCPTDY